MPRNGSGVYSPPAGSLVTTLTTVESAPHNAYVNDITSDLNTARPISAGGTGATNATAARTALGAAASGTNTDITSITTDSGGLKTKCGGSANTLALICGETLTASRYVNFVTGDADRTLTMHGSLAFGGQTYLGLTAAGAFPGYNLNIRCSAATDVTLPTSGTLATLAGAETLSNKTFSGNIILSGAEPIIYFNETDYAQYRLVMSNGNWYFQNHVLTSLLLIDSGGSGTFAGNLTTGGTITAGASISTGATVTAAGLSLSSASPTISMYDNDWGSLYIHANGGTMGFLNHLSAWSFQVDYSGNATATGNVTAYSDARLKKDIETIDDALELVQQMRGVRYTRTDTVQKGVGVIAQEIIDVLPEVVMEANDERKTLSVAYGNIVGVLIEAVKQLTARVEELEAKA